MNKQGLVSQVVRRTNIKPSDVSLMLEATLDAIQEAVARGQRVTIAGFGTFERKRRAARLGRNPHTGDPVPIPPTQVPAFRPADAFREYVLPKRRTAKRSSRRTR